MGTFWHKPGWTAADRDADGEIRADALRPGIYCEDQAALAQLRRGARVRSREMTATPSGWLLDGQAVFLCTPELAAMFRATATNGWRASRPTRGHLLHGWIVSAHIRPPTK
jgi:hypothetical protein